MTGLRHLVTLCREPGSRLGSGWRSDRCHCLGWSTRYREFHRLRHRVGNEVFSWAGRHPCRCCGYGGQSTPSTGHPTRRASVLAAGWESGPDAGRPGNGPARRSGLDVRAELDGYRAIAPLAPVGCASPPRRGTNMAPSVPGRLLLDRPWAERRIPTPARLVGRSGGAARPRRRDPATRCGCSRN